MSEKTEQPTPKKLRDARDKGQVASSKEVVSASLILAVFAFLWGMSGTYLAKFKEILLLPATLISADFDYALQVTVNGLLALMAGMLLPLLGLVIVVAILAHFFQYGLLFSSESLKPDLNKLNPTQGLKKIFSAKNLIELIKSLIKIGFLSLLLYSMIRSSLVDLVKLPRCGLACVPLMLEGLFKQLIINCAVVFMIVGAGDFMFQRFQHIKQLRMSKEEIKQEYKEMEGDPHIKSKRKHLHQEMLSQQTIQSVKNATIVITNPTHIAIALEYREGGTPLPVLRAKGENLVARRIVEIARQEGIPIMENVPLAHALHAQGLVDQYIPSDLIPAVAEVLRWVARLEDPRG